MSSSHRIRMRRIRRVGLGLAVARRARAVCAGEPRSGQHAVCTDVPVVRVDRRRVRRAAAFPGDRGRAALPGDRAVRPTIISGPSAAVDRRRKARRASTARAPLSSRRRAGRASTGRASSRSTRSTARAPARPRTCPRSRSTLRARHRTQSSGPQSRSCRSRIAAVGSRSASPWRPRRATEPTWPGPRPQWASASASRAALALAAALGMSRRRGTLQGA